VITPQADVNYGYSWFNISNGPYVIELPEYERYYSLSVFDMNHFVQEVVVKSTRAIVIRLAGQASPVADAHEVVLETNCGLAFLRMVIPEPDDQPAVMALTRQIRSSGGDGTEDFLIPEFTEEEREAALTVVKSYAMKQATGNLMFGKTSQGVGDMDRAAGVFLGQLGIPATFVQYTQYSRVEGEDQIGGDGSYEITVDPEGLIRDDDGYWSITVYDMEDRYLIPNERDRYSITSYTAVANQDGTFTIQINPSGEGENGIPTEGRPFYAVMRVYQPSGTVSFPPIRKTG
jgi:hypothetical protein